MAPQGQTRTNSAKTDRPPGGYTVLVVDDEEAVRHLASRMLTFTGYQTLEASHSREAIAALEQHAGAIHLVLTDIKMPGMNGRELGRHVEQRWPGKPILYMSGFASEVFQGGLLEPGRRSFPSPSPRTILPTRCGPSSAVDSIVYPNSAAPRPHISVAPVPQSPHRRT